jgi:hypothetical protein
MLHKPSVNVANIMKVIDSIRADDEFNMARWEHCVCGHVHRVKGDWETRRDDTLSALAFLGLSPEDNVEGDPIAVLLFSNGDHKDKDWAVNALTSLATLETVDSVPSAVS